MAEELDNLLVERMRFAARIVIAATIFYSVLDVILAQPHRAALRGLEAALILFAATTLALPRFPRLLPYAATVSTLLAAGLLVVIACGSLLRNEIQAGTTLMVITVLVGAAIIPWGLRSQVPVALTTLASIVGMLMIEPTALGVLTKDPAYIVAIGLGLGCSLPLSYQHRAARIEMFTEHHRLRAAQAEISAMNTVLERRVADRTAELEAAITDLRAFGYAISHDLRQPLRAVCSFAQILHDNAGDRLHVEEKDFAARIHAGAVRMDALLDEFLRLSRVASQRMHRERVDLSACMARVAENLQRRDPDRTLNWEIQPGLFVHGDAALLTLLLEELAGNAWKFTEGRDRASIAFGAETEGTTEPAFYVRDNGCGFEAGRNLEVFKLFSRAVDGSAADGFGTGLASAERIVKRHGGRIWAEGESGQGATFRFTIPQLPS